MWVVVSLNINVVDEDGMLICEYCKNKNDRLFLSLIGEVEYLCGLNVYNCDNTYRPIDIDKFINNFNNSKLKGVDNYIEIVSYLKRGFYLEILN